MQIINMTFEIVLTKKKIVLDYVFGFFERMGKITEETLFRISLNKVKTHTHTSLLCIREEKKYFYPLLLTN